MPHHLIKSKYLSLWWQLNNTRVEDTFKLSHSVWPAMHLSGVRHNACGAPDLPSPTLPAVSSGRESPHTPVLHFICDPAETWTALRSNRWHGGRGSRNKMWETELKRSEFRLICFVKWSQSLNSTTNLFYEGIFSQLRFLTFTCLFINLF